MPPTSKMLRWHIAFGLSVFPSIYPTHIPCKRDTASKLGKLIRDDVWIT